MIGEQFSVVRWRPSLAAVIIVVSVIVIANMYRSDRRPFQPANRREVTLVYVGAQDCAPCRSWHRRGGEASLSSSEFSGLSYRQVESPTVLDLLKDQYWPDDLRAYRNRLDPRAGVPLWLVISDHEIVEQAFGESQWENAVLPRLKTLLR
jgi:hypothetical protein